MMLCRFARMKRHYPIGLFLLLALLAACTSVPEPAVAEQSRSIEGPTQKLSSIDSLMWQQPDSALQALMAYEGDASEYNHHYAQLLTSELLYKNYYEQTNRPELQQAVAYFDSLMQVSEPQRSLSLSKGRSASAKTTAFLAARAHYINGVGYYERDSVIEACREYLKALEVMEGHFEEKEMVGEKARFMALTYTRLTELFSDFYLHEQAIYFAKHSLEYHKKQESLWHYAWALNEIGSQYEMTKALDSAEYYYQKANVALNDTNTLLYRDIAMHQACLMYKKDRYTYTVLMELHRIISKSESEIERMARCLTIGEVFYHEQEYDSAKVYLDEVFRGLSSTGAKKQAAEWLVEICKIQGETSEIMEYAEFLVPFTNLNEEQSSLKSRLTNEHLDFEKKKQERIHRLKSENNHKKVVTIIASLIVMMALIAMLYFVNHLRNKRLQMEKDNTNRLLETERQTHRMEQSALSSRLKRSNEALRQKKEETKVLIKELEMHKMQTDWNKLDEFMNEDICIEILASLQGKDIKREAKSDAYPELHLGVSQLSRLEVAVEKHFNGLGKTLSDLYPRISRDEMYQCLLYLLNLEDVQIAALLDCDYSTVKKRSAKLKKHFGIEKDLFLFIREFVL